MDRISKDIKCIECFRPCCQKKTLISADSFFSQAFFSIIFIASIDLLQVSFEMISEGMVCSKVNGIFIHEKRMKSSKKNWENFPQFKTLS